MDLKRSVDFQGLGPPPGLPYIESLRIPLRSFTYLEPEGKQGPKGPLRALKGPGRAKWPLKGQGPKGPLRALKGPLRAGLMWTLLSTMWH